MATIERVLAMGFFDGVHVGHAALLNKTIERASELGAVPSVLSFDVHPDNLVFNRPVPLINDARGREEIIRRCFGIDNVVFLHFTRGLMNMPWEEFAETIVAELNVVGFVVGYDFTFGRKGEGSGSNLSRFCLERGIACDVIPPVTLDGQIVSSTLIRKMVEEGEMEQAMRYLGHPHCLSDTVHSGYHIGRRLDAPTINMFFPEGVIIPKHGVYATRVALPDGEEYPAVTNVGVRPTFEGDGRVSVESHLFGYTGNLYGVPTRLDFYHFIRPEVKFDSYDALADQIRRDADAAEAYFSAHPLKRVSEGKENSSICR